jgi:ADP-ribose pyrophosphatase YjhB (NUDIX family)
MTEGIHTMFDGTREVTVAVPVSGDENVMVPVIRAVVKNSDGSDSILLQRRANPEEAVFGLYELPGGTWRAGESPDMAISREVHEETGVLLTSVSGIEIDTLDSRRAIATVTPIAVVAGVRGAFPAIHVVVAASGTGVPESVDGEAFDARWWPTMSVRIEMSERPAAFVPSTLAALKAYFGSVGLERD